MRIERAQRKPSRATAWVTATDMSGTGTDVVESSNMALDLSALPDLAGMPIVEVEVSHRLTGGTGSSQVWLRFPNHNPVVAVNTAEVNAFGNFDLGALQASGTLRDRRIRVQTSVLQNRGATSVADQLDVRIRARGSAVDSEWEVTGIRARLVYEPL